MKKFNQTFKDKISHFCSIALIFFIPVLIIVNGLWRITAYQKDVNFDLNEKIKLVQTILAKDLDELTLDQTNLTQEITEIKQASSQIRSIAVISQKNNNFPVLASTSSDLVGVEINDSDLTQVMADNKTITRSYKDMANKRVWLAVGPIINDAGQTQAILALTLDSTETDNLTKATINQSLVTLVITVFLVFLLLLNHFRFFEYFINYRRIEEIDRMKDEFINMVSHELKTPLATIKGYLDMMFQGLVGKFDEKAKEHLQKVSANIQRLDLLVSELLDVSRLEQQRMQFDMQPTDIGKVIEGVVNELEDEAIRKNLKLEHHALEKFPAVFADPDRLHQVFENLLSNALKYTQKGLVQIDYRIDKNKLRTTVKDTGIGMSGQDMKRLFERFYRIKNEKTMDITGTGLGLWITKTITEKMNGIIEVSSRENVGTEFTVVLPIIKER